MPSTAATVPPKEAAISFLTLASAGKVREAYDRFIGPGFRHHNPYFPADAASLAAAMEQNASENPGKVIEPIHVLGDGDLVAVHARVRLKPGGKDIAICHLYRFAEGRIIELWDIAQPEPDQSPNQNGMF
jgi:predicted SnoaL-like aldol condensation-catalyzing enzyme